MNDERIIVLLQDILGLPLNPNVKWVYYDCPFCHHHRKKFAVNRLTLVWKCWVCLLYGSNLFSLIRKTNKWHLFERVRRTTLKYTLKKEIKSLNISDTKLPREAIRLADGTSFITKKKVYKYLRSRNITDYLILKYNIHFAPTGRYSDRIIFPSYDILSNLNYFTARSIDKNLRLKYLNPEAAKDFVIVYENMINWKFPIILTEGIFDAIAVNFNAIPLMGKTINNILLLKLIYYDALVCVVLDSDAWEDQVKLMTKLKSLGLLEIFYIKLNGLKDPSNLGRLGFWKLYQTSRHKFNILQRLDILKLKLGGINF